jgi:hypothetical protein
MSETTEQTQCNALCKCQEHCHLNPTLRVEPRNDNIKTFIYLFSLALQPSAGYGLVSRGFVITHDTPQSVGLLWTSDQSVAETST